MKTIRSSLFGFFFGFIIFSSLNSASLPPDFWVSDGVKVNPKPKQIWVDTFSMETAKIDANKNERETHLFKTEFPIALQNEIVEGLMEIAPSKVLWNEKPSSELWIVKGNVIELADSFFEKGWARDVGQQISNSMKVKRFRTEVFIYDTSHSKEHYVLKFQTGWSSQKEKPINVPETVSEVVKTLKAYLNK